METFFSGPVGNYRAQLGESPVWCNHSQSLLWVDIERQRRLRYWPTRDVIEQRPFATLFSAALLTERHEQFLLASDQGILLYRWDDHQAQPATLCPYPLDAAGTRPNEAAIAPDGSLWFSTMDINESAPLGGWYRFAPGDTRPVKMAGAMAIPNTLAWHEDRVWGADSAERLFFSASGLGILPQEMRRHPADDMTPDGSALSREGELITARFGHGCLSRYRSYSPAAALSAALTARRCTLPRHVSNLLPPANWTARCCRPPPIPAARQRIDSGSIKPRRRSAPPTRAGERRGFHRRRWYSIGGGVIPPFSLPDAALSVPRTRYSPRGR